MRSELSKKSAVSKPSRRHSVLAGLCSTSRRKSLLFNVLRAPRGPTSRPLRVIRTPELLDVPLPLSWPLWLQLTRVYHGIPTGHFAGRHHHLGMPPALPELRTPWHLLRTYRHEDLKQSRIRTPVSEVGAEGQRSAIPTLLNTSRRSHIS